MRAFGGSLRRAGQTRFAPASLTAWPARSTASVSKPPIASRSISASPTTRPPRLDAGTARARDAAGAGHTAHPQGELIDYAANLLETSGELLAARLTALVETKQLVRHGPGADGAGKLQTPNAKSQTSDSHSALNAQLNQHPALNPHHSTLICSSCPSSTAPNGKSPRSSSASAASAAACRRSRPAPPSSGRSRRRASPSTNCSAPRCRMRSPTNFPFSPAAPAPARQPSSARWCKS